MSSGSSGKCTCAGFGLVRVHDDHCPSRQPAQPVEEVKPKRVGAILKANSTTVYLFGYGVHVGDRVHPQWGMPNPCIELDGGGIVFGIECWWGSEDRVRDSIKGREVVIVPPPDRTETTNE